MTHRIHHHDSGRRRAGALVACILALAGGSALAAPEIRGITYVANPDLDTCGKPDAPQCCSGLMVRLRVGAEPGEGEAPQRLEFSEDALRGLEQGESLALTIGGEPVKLGPGRVAVDPGDAVENRERATASKVRLVVLLDTSLSMSRAAPDGRDRLTVARDEIEGFLDAVHGLKSEGRISEAEVALAEFSATYPSSEMLAFETPRNAARTLKDIYCRAQWTPARDCRKNSKAQHMLTTLYNAASEAHEFILRENKRAPEWRYMLLLLTDGENDLVDGNYRAFHPTDARRGWMWDPSDGDDRFIDGAGDAGGELDAFLDALAQSRAIEAPYLSVGVRLGDPPPSLAHKLDRLTPDGNDLAGDARGALKRILTQAVDTLVNEIVVTVATDHPSPLSVNGETIVFELLGVPARPETLPNVSMQNEHAYKRPIRPIESEALCNIADGTTIVRNCGRPPLTIFLCGLILLAVLWFGVPRLLWATANPTHG